MCSVLMPLFHQIYYHLLKIVNSKCLLSVNGMSMINNYLVNNKKFVGNVGLETCMYIYFLEIYLSNMQQFYICKTRSYTINIFACAYYA